MNWVEEVLRLEVQKNVWLESDSRSEDCSTYSVDVIKTLVDLGSSWSMSIVGRSVGSRLRSFIDC